MNTLYGSMRAQVTLNLELRAPFEGDLRQSASTSDRDVSRGLTLALIHTQCFISLRIRNEVLNTN